MKERARFETWKLALLLPLVALLGAGYAVLGPGTRIPTWLGGAGDLESIQATLAQLETEVAGLEREAELLRADPLTIERAIRVDLRLAKDGETVLHLDRDMRSNPRFP